MRRLAILLIIGGSIILATTLAVTRVASAGPVAVAVEITDAGFNPPVVTVPSHSTVTWTNAGSQSHSIVGDPGNALESPSLAPRFTYSYTFHSTGTFAYHDPGNSQIKGLVIVQDGAVPPEPALNAPSPAPSPPEATAIAPSQPEALSDIPAGGDDPSFQGAASAPPDASAHERSAPEPDADQPSGPQSPSNAPETSIELGNEWFGDPAYQSGVYESVVEQGGTVRWTVLEGIHNVYECGENWTKSGSCAAADWNSAQIISAGNSFSHTFNSPGRFFYTCTIHPATMRGVVVVNSPSAPADSNPSSDSQPDPAPADPRAVGIPAGGGPPLSPGDSRLTMILIGAAIAFVISTLTFVGGGVRAKK